MSAGRLFVDRAILFGDAQHGLFPMTIESGGAVVELMVTRHVLTRLDSEASRALKLAIALDQCAAPVPALLRRKGG